MNVLFVDQFCELGGAQRVLLDVLPAVIRRGWGAHLALPGGGPLAYEAASLGAVVSTIPCGPYAFGTKTLMDYARFLWDAPRAAVILARIVRERRIDLVYANGPRILAAASHGGAPLLFHAHSRLTRKHDQWLLRHALRGAAVLANSQFVAGSLRPFAREVRVVSNGTPDLGYRAWRPSMGRLRFGVVGRIAPEKGQLEFADAVRQAHGDMPECRFVICGQPLFADRGYETAVLRRCADLPVEFVRWKDTPGDALDQIDVLVVPSGPNDAMPLVIIEAFSAGIPVVAFASGGIPETVVDGETGFLVGERSPEALAAKLREVAADPARRERIARRARRAWERLYTLPSFLNQVLGFMEDTVSLSSTQKSRPASAAATAAEKRAAR